MGKITKNYIYNVIYQIVSIVVPLIIAPYLARTLGVEGTGTFGYVNSFTSLICTIVLLGVYNYGNRQTAYVRDDINQLNDVFSRMMTARIVITVFGTIVYACAVMIVGKYHMLFLIYYTYMLGCFIDCTWLYVGVEDMKWAVLKNIFMRVVAVIGIFVFVKGENDLPIYVLIQGGSVLLANLLAYTQLKKYISRFSLVWKYVLHDLKQSALLFLPSVASVLYLQCDKIMIELMTGNTEQVSFYDYSEKIVLIPLSFITVLSTVMMPRIANEFKKGNYDRISELISRAARVSVWMAMPLLFGIILLSDKLIPWYLGDAFLPSVTSIKIISVIILTNTLSGISGSQYFTATDQIKILLKSQIIAAVENILLNALLIPFYGFIGAAIATVVSSVTCAVVQYWYLLKQVKIEGLFSSILKYTLISLSFFVIVELVTRNMESSPVTTLIQILMSVVIYFAVCLIIRDQETMDIIRKRIKKRH